MDNNKKVNFNIAKTNNSKIIKQPQIQYNRIEGSSRITLLIQIKYSKFKIYQMKYPQPKLLDMLIWQELKLNNLHN